MVKSKELKTLENSTIELSITVEKDSIKKEYDELLKKYAKTAHMKGFRKGKVPTAIIERKFADSIKTEAGYNIMEKSLEEVLKDVEKKPLPNYTPRLENEESLTVEMDKDLTFSVTYETYPEITLGQYKGLEIEIPEVELSDEDMDRELKRFQEQNAVVSEKAGGTVEKDNVVTINYFELDENGNQKEGTSREDFTFTVGTGYNYYKIDDDIIGMKSGEEKVIEKSFPEDFEYSELAGKTVKISIKITNVKSKQLPAIDDELAQDISEKYKTLDDLKKDIKERQEGMIQQRMTSIKNGRILTKIIENSTLEVPASMTEHELEHSWQNFMYQFGGDEKKVEQILALQNKTKADLVAEWEPSAINSVKGQLLINKIAEEEKVEVSEAELDEEIAKQAAQGGMPVEDFKKYVENNHMLEYMRHSVRDQKAYDILEKSAVVKTGDKMKFLDFLSLNS